MCYAGGKALKRRLVHSVALTIMASNNFIPLLYSSIANILKFKACFIAKFKCISITMCSLVMSPFSHDFINGNRLIKVSAMFQLTYHVQTSQLSRCERESHSFKAILTVSRLNANFSLSFTVTHSFLIKSWVINLSCLGAYLQIY